MSTIGGYATSLLAVCCLGLVCPAAGLFAAELPPPPAKIVRYTAVMIQRYDINGDGILQQEEWKKIPGTPQAIDLNGDGQITGDELVWYMNHYGQSRTIHRDLARDVSKPFDPENLRFLRPVSRSRPGSLSSPLTESDDGFEAMIKENEQPVDDDLYQKIMKERQVPDPRPYHVLPESLRGVPAWFILLDKNGDGQISLHELAPMLERRRVELFKTLDKDGNGFIEPHEIRTP